jgi:hypothetical protein
MALSMLAVPSRRVCKRLTNMASGGSQLAARRYSKQHSEADRGKEKCDDE